jgi:hypothetical protein
MPLPARALTDGEWRAITPGLAGALRRAGAAPRIVAAAHPAARIASMWRGSVPALTRGDEVWWRRAPQDASKPGLERLMAVLQHELQHVLDYRTGRLSALAYLSNPANWLYDWSNARSRGWDELGAEQRASMAEQLWLAERGGAPPGDLAFLRSRIPWAADEP